MNVKEIKEMIALMNENGLTELEIEKEGLKLKLKKSNGGYTSEFSVIPSGHTVSPATAPLIQPAAAVAKESEADAKGLTEIKSPMVGTFYRAPAPDAAPYAQEGQNVDVGQVVCIVEAMKLMNEIKSEVKGKIVKILTNNADPVEFGQAMFLIDAAK